MQRTASSIGEVLVQRGVLTPETLATAQQEAADTHVRLEHLLVKNKTVSTGDMTLAVADYLRMAPIALGRFAADPALVEIVPFQWLEQFKALPVHRQGQMLFVAMADPFDISAGEMLHTLSGLEIIPLVAAEREVLDILERQAKKTSQVLQDVLKEVAEQEGDVEVDRTVSEDISLDAIKEIAEEAPVIRIVNSVMLEALRQHASDVHIEPMEKTMRLRYRIDGVLYENPSPPKRLHSAIASRIKILSNLNIAERRVPQDGRFKIRAMGREADVRVSILPTVHGEKIVMRLLDKSQLAPGLAHLGLDPQAYENFSYAIQQPHGMILVTGPTGSGKTTTLYSCLQDLNQIDVNIITVEDPVEYQLPGINQVQTHSEIGLSFAAGLRSILRQDPDIVMVGEIRDSETATIAVQAALTGHLVLSTLHTNDAAGAVARMVNMGIEPFLLASSLLMTQAQRLYRRICTVCREPREFPAEQLRLNHLDPADFEGVTFYHPRGCPKCGNIGYKGRGALMEILMISDPIREQMMRDANATKIREIAVREGMLTLRDVGMNKVRDGITSIEEVLRVTTGE